MKILISEKVNLIVINQKVEDSRIYTFLQDIRNRGYKTKLFGILPNNSTYITNCIKSGLNDYIEQKRINHGCILCRLEKLIHLTDENILEIYSRGCIYLNPDIQTAYVSGKKIDLTESETKILKYMLERDKPCTSEEIKIYLCSTIKEESIRVIIHRLMKKMRYILGYSIIKNTYRKGYYIDY